jgi:tripartite-type tricarboxylate transporter receptor subunit TctC
LRSHLVGADRGPFDRAGASNEIMNALIGGHIDVALDNITLVLPQVKAGTVRPIGMSTSRLRSLGMARRFPAFGRAGVDR